LQHAVFKVFRNLQIVRRFRKSWVGEVPDLPQIVIIEVDSRRLAVGVADDEEFVGYHCANVGPVKLSEVLHQCHVLAHQHGLLVQREDSLDDELFVHSEESER